MSAATVLVVLGATLSALPSGPVRVDAARQANAPSQPLNASVNEVGIRRYATNVVPPGYPDESVRLGHEGVAVAGIQFAPTGQMERIEILEAPDSFIAASMKEALAQWTLPQQGAAPPRMSSKATYYFVISAGKGSVFAPAAAPLARDWNSRTTILDRQSVLRGEKQ
jgi:hypothetical protein